MAMLIYAALGSTPGTRAARHWPLHVARDRAVCGRVGLSRLIDEPSAYLDSEQRIAVKV